MGDRKAIPGFGQVDLDMGDDAATHGSPTVPPKGFGHVDLEVDSEPEPAPPSTSRVFNADGRPAGMRARATSVHDESTRILAGDALSAMTRTAPPQALHEDGATRAWADIDGELAAADDPPSSRSGNQSASGVAARGDDRVAAMRDLYARGDAAGALALASTLGHSLAQPSTTPSADSPDASVVVEFSEQSIDGYDPFGGLVPFDEPDEESPLSKASATRTVPPPAAQLTLTERQSIPRRLTALADMSKLKIDHRAGFLLAHIDGMQTLEEILDVCAMPAEEALALIANLKASGVIEFE